MEMNLGMSKSEADKTGNRGTDEAKKLKSRGNWNSTGDGNDFVGFKALPAGYGGQQGDFGFLGDKGYWWSSTVYNVERTWIRSMSSSNDRVSRDFAFKATKY